MEKQKLFNAGATAQLGRTVETLKSLGHTPKAARLLAESLYQASSAVIDKSFAVSRPACRAGCAHCCRIPVLVTPVEALAMGRYVEKHFSKEQRDVLIASLTEHVKRVSGMGPEELPKHRSACALLSEDERCRAYPVRPVACRATNSFSAEQCRENAPEIESDGYALLWGAAVIEGLRRGLGAAELDARVYELGGALLLVLSRPDAEAAWLAGKSFAELAGAVAHPLL